MNLKDSPRLEEICSRYVLGVMHGSTRRQFSKYIEQQPFLFKRVMQVGQAWSLDWSSLKTRIGINPPKTSWQKLHQALNAEKPGHFFDKSSSSTPANHHEGPWFTSIWNRWIAATAFASSFALLFAQLQPLPMAELQQIGLNTQQTLAIRALEQDGQISLTIYGVAGFGAQQFKAPLTAIAGATQDYELWMIRPGEKTPESLGLLRDIYWKKEKSAVLHQMIQSSATLAVSVEPKGGSRTGLPSGGVTILKIST